MGRDYKFSFCFLLLCAAVVVHTRKVPLGCWSKVNEHHHASNGAIVRGGVGFINQCLQDTDIASISDTKTGYKLQTQCRWERGTKVGWTGAFIDLNRDQFPDCRKQQP